MNDVKVDKVDSLNKTMIGLENDLMARALDRRDDQIDHAMGFINQLADDEIVEIECGDCENDDEGESDDSEDENSEEEEQDD